MDVLHLTALEPVDEILGDLAGMLIGRLLAEPCILPNDRVFAGLEVCLGLAPYRHKLGIRFVLDLLARLLEGVAGVGSRKALVGGQHQKELFPFLVDGQQRMAEIPRVGRDIMDDLRYLFCIGLVGGGRFFRMAQPRAGDHVHGVRDLLGVLYASDAAAYVL